MPDFDLFFREYADLYTKALGAKPDYKAIQDRFAECFIGAGPAGVVCGENGAEFKAKLEEGYAFYKKIGTKRMNVRRTEATPIDADHHLVKVFYRGEYEKKDGETMTIDFDVAYVLETRKKRTRILAFVAGDEMEIYRLAGLIDDQRPRQTASTRASRPQRKR